MESLLKYSPVMLHLSPATKNLNENPVNLHCRLRTFNLIINFVPVTGQNHIQDKFRINLGFWETEHPPLP